MDKELGDKYFLRNINLYISFTPLMLGYTSYTTFKVV